LVLFFCAAFFGQAADAAAPYSAADLYAFQGTPYAVAGGQVGGAWGGAPALWTADGALHNLNSPGEFSGAVYGIGGIFQVGFVNQDAALWQGSASGGWLNLGSATSFTYSAATAIGGTAPNQVIVGYGSPGNGNVAVMWSGAYFATVTGLNGVHYSSSEALGTDGVHQVGWGTDAAGKHALMWAGSADSVIDLTPANIPGFTNAEAFGVQGQQQVGELLDAQNKTNAVVWSGSAASAIDLQPLNLTGILESVAVATNGTQQVGWGDNGTPGAAPSALLWSGSADSVVDLQSLLNPAEFVSSQAYSIDADGNVFGIATDTSGQEHAIEWQAVPEPAGLGVLVLAGMMLRRTKGSV